MAKGGLTGIFRGSRNYSNGGWSRRIHPGCVAILRLAALVCGFVSFAAQRVSVACCLELGYTGYRRFHDGFAEEGASLALGPTPGG